MTEFVRFGTDADLAALLTIAPAGVDDLAGVRLLHTRSLRAYGARILDGSEIAGLLAHVNSADYVDELRRQELIVGWIGDELVATGTWRDHVDRDQVRSARMEAVCVNPLFANCGIGSRMVREIEALAIAAGISELAVRAPVGMTGFYERLGYRITSHGTRILGGAPGLPVAFLRRSTRPAAAAGTTSVSQFDAGAPPA